MRTVSSLWRTRRRCLAAIGAAFVLARWIYASMGVTFDSSPRLFYWQMIDPVLLRDAPWQSLFYLRNQPPLLNAFIAMVTHLFPAHPGRAFQPIYLGMGIVWGVSLFLVLDRLGVRRWFSVLITVVWAVSPITAIYENWLFYEYPIATLFCVAALFLHRYASAGHRKCDGLVFFTCLTLLGLFRVLYHWTWFLAIAGLIVYALPGCRRRTAWCAAGPGVFLLAFYLKSLLLFGVWLPGGDVYGSIALSTLARGNLTNYEIARLAKRGVISRVLVYDLDNVEKLTPMIPLPKPTGIPILDHPLKSTGVASLDSLWMVEVCKQVRKDGLRLLRYRPIGAFQSIRDNLGRYFLPADIGWPFDGRPDANALIMAPVLSRFDLLTTGTIPGHQFAWLSYVTVPVLLGFGLLRSFRWVRGHCRNADDLTMLFAFGNIAFLTCVILFYDFTDQNRIIWEMSPLFSVLLGGLSVWAGRAISGSR